MPLLKILTLKEGVKGWCVSQISFDFVLKQSAEDVQYSDDRKLGKWGDGRKKYKKKDLEAIRWGSLNSVVG